MNILLILGYAVSIAAYSTLPGRWETWFRQATAIYQLVEPVKMAAPDFLPGSSVRSTCAAYGDGGPFLGELTWSVVAYDKPHGLFLAGVHNDECGIALVKAAAPLAVPRSVKRADLAGFVTARGLRIGSSYAAVLRLYGGPAKHGVHFAVRYSAAVPAHTPSLSMLDRATEETVTVVIDAGRVTSITVQIRENG